MTDSTPLPWPGSRSGPSVSDSDLLLRVASGDTAAFSTLYDRISPWVYGLIRRVLRNPAQSEEVTQEVMIDIWRTATRFDAGRGSAQAWILTIAHRRAVDRVRSEQASTDRTALVAARTVEVEYDEVSDTVSTRLEAEQVRRCLDTLTDLQRESINLAYYNGYTYVEVAQQLDAKLPTIKARMRDGLIRLRDCLGTTKGGTR
ncbi:ECF RNA polymerase sigma factor SigK [Kribbella sandramycini]|uniref:RNA polymerase sigma factor n=1 Tax=Kribbella sandramycini TaxID=60450 RepID=A0A7Y4P2V0_9ACTN|nr:RNA polymerase sigma-70 factor (ECF subfamily) [Kribbella sandramycini]NOL45782.1 ECF RNA polymerase sigma factor SigK [Kribbella sandramycini]